MTQAPLTLRRWRRVEYERLVELGVLDRDHVELIGGNLLVAEPQNSAHATAVGAVDDALRAVLPAGYIVRAQMPLALDDESAPEPDVAVVAGARADYRHVHPTRPVLVVEVADASLDFDRREKGSLYARARVEDYWIVNLVDHVLEVYRGPERAAAAPYGWGYQSKTTLAPPSLVAPRALPSTQVPVADLFG